MKELDNFILKGLLKRLLSEKTIRPVFFVYLQHVLDYKKHGRTEETPKQLTLEHVKAELLTQQQLEAAKNLLTHTLASHEELYPHRHSILSIANWPENHLRFLRDVFEDYRFSLN